MERQYYLWSVGGGTVSVALSPEIIDRLRNAAGVSEEGEVGGILLGRRESEERIFIEDFELLNSEHRRGPTFTLSQADRRKLIQRLRSTHHGLESLGSFRTHLRQGLYMDQYDFDLMSSHFAAPSDVMLLVRPADWQGGFFVWEEGDIHRQKSYREFPFNAAALPLTTIITGRPEYKTEYAFAAAAPAPLPTTVGEGKLLVPPRGIKSGAMESLEPALRRAATVLQIPRKTPAAVLMSRTSLPTLAKAGLIAATFGLVGVLAFYAHEHRTSSVSARVNAPAASNSLIAGKPSSGDIKPPVDPDAAQPPSQGPDPGEMHVKIPEPVEPSYPIEASRPPKPDASQPIVVELPRPMADTPPQAPAPSPTPAVPTETAESVPPSLPAPLAIKPTLVPVVSSVSLEPATPGLISRSINHIPVLNLIQRHKYKAGENFYPARPLRQVKPRVPTDWQGEHGYPAPLDIKVWIDKSGQVTKAEILSDHAAPVIADIASNAALKWTFEPAHLADRAVPSEMVMHFRFAPKQTY